MVDAVTATVAMAIATHIFLRPTAELSWAEFLVCMGTLVAVIVLSLHPDQALDGASRIKDALRRSFDRVRFQGASLRMLQQQVDMRWGHWGSTTTTIRERFADGADGIRDAIKTNWLGGVDRIIDALHKDTRPDRKPEIKQVDLSKERFAKSAAPVTGPAALAAVQLEYKKIGMWWCMLRTSCPAEYAALMLALGAPPISYEAGPSGGGSGGEGGEGDDGGGDDGDA
jgi:hypothetical protein